MLREISKTLKRFLKHRCFSLCDHFPPFFSGVWPGNGCGMGPWPEARDHVSIDFGDQRFSLLWQQLGTEFPPKFWHIRKGLKIPRWWPCFFLNPGGANTGQLRIVLPVGVQKNHSVQAFWDVRNFWGNCQRYNTQAERLACRATATTYCNAKFLDFLKLAHTFSWGNSEGFGGQQVSGMSFCSLVRLCWLW